LLLAALGGNEKLADLTAAAPIYMSSLRAAACLRDWKMCTDQMEALGDKDSDFPQKP
jgi:hypothetical protein